MENRFTNCFFYFYLNKIHKSSEISETGMIRDRSYHDDMLPFSIGLKVKLKTTYIVNLKCPPPLPGRSEGEIGLEKYEKAKRKRGKEEKKIKR